MRPDLVKGFHTLVAEFAATGEVSRVISGRAIWAMGTRLEGNLLLFRDVINAIPSTCPIVLRHAQAPLAQTPFALRIDIVQCSIH